MTKPLRWLIWALLGLILILFIGFSVRLALTTFRQRSGAPQISRTPPALTVPMIGRTTRTATRPPAPTVAVATATRPAPTETPTTEPPTDTPTPGPTAPPPTPERACTRPVAPEFTDLYDAPTLGCPAGDAATVWAAWERFERGAMLWRSDTDAAYAFFDDGRWLEIAERWDGSPPSGRGAPPAGRVAPERGFGWVWSRRGDIFAGVGWAIETEKGFCAIVQQFDRGFILRSSATPTCTTDNLYNFATAPAWLPLTRVVYPEGWSESRPTAAVGPTAAVRPTAQGSIPAPPLGDLVLDGYTDEWPEAWQPITAIVEGAGDWEGEADLAGAFQVAWTPEGLYLAVRVADDVYQPGADGAEMWRGDSLEINFDRDLAGDADNSVSDADDYQIGLSYGPMLAEMRAYRWLPFAQEGPLVVTGAAVTTPDGYSIEVLIPWQVFAVAAAELAPGKAFGFNLALNDSDAPAAGVTQQTVAASSPARATYDNPTQWGELVLR